MAVLFSIVQPAYNPFSYLDLENKLKFLSLLLQITENQFFQEDGKFTGRSEVETENEKARIINFNDFYEILIFVHF